MCSRWLSVEVGRIRGKFQGARPGIVYLPARLLFLISILDCHDTSSFCPQCPLAMPFLPWSLVTRNHNYEPKQICLPSNCGCQVLCPSNRTSNWDDLMPVSISVLRVLYRLTSLSMAITSIQLSGDLPFSLTCQEVQCLVRGNQFYLERVYGHTKLYSFMNWKIQTYIYLISMLLCRLMISKRKVIEIQKQGLWRALYRAILFWKHKWNITHFSLTEFLNYKIWLLPLFKEMFSIPVFCWSCGWIAFSQSFPQSLQHWR